MTHSELSRISGETSPRISRLENAHEANQVSVLNILDALGVKGDEWARIVSIARDAASEGWWNSNRDMGVRQMLHADLEAGAVRIREYLPAFMPELLQEPEYTRVLWSANNNTQPGSFTVDGVMKGVVMRQLMLHNYDARTYEVIIEEAALCRLSAPPRIFEQQLRHLIQAADDNPRISLRVLPIAASMPDYNGPCCPFSLFAYPEDPGIVVISSGIMDHIFDDSTDCAHYERLYDAMCETAYPQEKSLDLIAEIACKVAEA